jgi:hypothetical protein
MDNTAIVAIVVNIIGIVLYHVINHFIFINDLKNRICILEAKFEPFWAMVEDSLIKVLKHPTELRLDYLIDELPNLKSSEELIELKELIVKEYNKLLELKNPNAVVAALAISLINSKLSTNNKNNNFFKRKDGCNER